MPDVISWIDPTGSEHLLDDPANGLKIAPGRSDLFMPPVTVNEMAVPGIDGAAYLGTTVSTRELDLPLQVFADDEATLRSRLRTLMGWFNPRLGNGMGSLKVVGPDAGSRSIGCYYAGGLGLAEPAADKRNRIQRCTIILRCLDPYWSASTSTHYSFTPGASGMFFPFFPLTLGAGLVGSQTITNAGDVDAWPVWTLTGPFTSFSAINTTTGRSFTLTYSAAAAEQVVIDTRPTVKTVTSASGANLFGGFVGTLWPFPPGGNDILFAVAGDSAVTLVDLDFSLRYLAP